MHDVTVETHEDLLTGKVHILVLHLRRAIESGLRIDGIIGQ